MAKSVMFYIMVLGVFLTFSCERNVDESELDESVNSEYHEDESDYTWDKDGATLITLSSTSIEINGEGATANGQQVVIEKGGDFLVQGTLTDGQIKVSAGDEDKVKLVLDNVTLNCSNSAPIFVENSVRTIIILEEGSENVLTDGSSYSSDEINAAVFSKSDLAISGTGKLTVTANYNDGITSKDGLIIDSGVFDITAADDGIRGKDYLVIKKGTFSIDAKGDALKSDNEDEGFGYIDIIDGDFNLTAVGDGAHAFYNLSVTDGNFDINCTGTSDSSKGLKAGLSLKISSGVFNIESVDDAIHSDQDVLIESGAFTIYTKDDAVHAENELTINYAEMTVTNSYEALEGKTITIVDGEFSLTASDDGINAASGSSSEGFGGPQPGGSSGDNLLVVSGGNIAVFAGGDGIDANGSIEISGGQILVHGPSDNGNAAFDYDGNCKMTGGLLIAAGSSGMAQMPGTSSSQYSVLANLSSSKSGGTLFHIEDADGNEVFTFRPEKTYQSVAFSSPKLSNGTTYNIYLGGSYDGSLSNGLYNNGTYTEGEIYDSFTISSITTTVGSSGGPGGGGPRG